MNHSKCLVSYVFELRLLRGCRLHIQSDRCDSLIFDKCFQNGSAWEFEISRRNAVASIIIAMHCICPCLCIFTEGNGELGAPSSKMPNRRYAKRCLRFFRRKAGRGWMNCDGSIIAAQCDKVACQFIPGNWYGSCSGWSRLNSCALHERIMEHRKLRR